MSEKTEEYLFKNFKDYRDYLDMGPEDSWLQQRSLGAGKTHQFIPVFVIQATADAVFREWFVIEEKAMGIQNGIAFTVKIEATPDYPGAEAIYFTGSAAIPFKDVKNAVEFDVPNARERAIAKAFQTLGNIFGRSLNRSYKTAKGNKVTIQPDMSFRRKAEEVEK